MAKSSVRVLRRIRGVARALMVASLPFLVKTAAAVPGGNADGAGDPGPATELAAILTPIREKHKLPGLAAVIAVGDRVVASGAVGVRARGFDAPITIDDKFHLGSCTKAMTATLVGVLVDEGTLKFDATLPELLPEFAAGMHERYRGATLRHLLQNRAGVPGDLTAHGVWAALWRQDGTPTEKRRQMARDVLSREPRSEPGTTFEYSNGSFTIAGLVAEVATGKSWDELMREKVFGPLGIVSAGFGAPGTARVGDAGPDQPRGHGANGKPVEPGLMADNPPAIGPAGTVHMSLPDWAKFTAVHLGRDGAEGKGLVTDATLREMHTLPANAKAGSPGAEYVMGWARVERPWAGGAALTHSGSNTMWFAVAWLAPERGFSILIATNVAEPNGPKACDEVAGALIEHARRHAEKSRGK